MAARCPSLCGFRLVPVRFQAPVVHIPNGSWTFGGLVVLSVCLHKFI
ncbi:hypothetical protein [Bacillus sp. 007/AIA-02/001]|nr:hypothetical protein [Bacillus sp. 007/AIA-02/001]